MSKKKDKMKLTATYGKNGLPELPAIRERRMPRILVVLCFPCVNCEVVKPDKESKQEPLPRFTGPFVGRA